VSGTEPQPSSYPTSWPVTTLTQLFQPSNYSLPYWSGDVNCSTWLMKNMLYENNKIKLLHKWHFLENTTEKKGHFSKCSKFHYCL
jgi:hypothetical protein